MSTVQYGNKEIDVKDIVRLTTLAGPIGEDDSDTDAIFLRFERDTYTRAEVIELVQIFARIEPDECELSGPYLRCWWD